MVLHYFILRELFFFGISVRPSVLYPYDPFHIMPMCCHCFLWALSYPLLDDTFESLYYAPYNFSSAHNTCIGRHPAHSRHWQIGVHDAEVRISTTLNCIKFILFLKRQKQQKNVMWTTQKFEDKKKPKTKKLFLESRHVPWLRPFTMNANLQQLWYPWVSMREQSSSSAVHSQPQGLAHLILFELWVPVLLLRFMNSHSITGGRYSI